jgi:AcrR family transcriptional regulator
MTSPTHETTLEQKTKKLREGAADVYRRAILDAAEKVFGRRGFAEAKISEIAKETGLGVGTLYNYFSSKESIFTALLEDRGEAMAAEIERIARAPGDPIERIWNLVRAKCQFLEAHIDMLEIFAQAGLRSGLGVGKLCGPGFEERKARILGGYELAVREAVKEGKLRKDISARELSASLNGLINGMTNSWMAGSRTSKLTAAVIQTVMTIFLEGAARS